MTPIDHPDFSRDVHCLLGLPFDATDLPGALRALRRATESRKPLFISTPNLNFLIACQTDADFRNSVINSELSLADGMPIVWLARLLDIPIYERVAGSSLFEALRNHPAGVSGKPLSVFFFGGPDGVAQTACQRINSELNTAEHGLGGGLRCVGYESPGFGSIEDMSDSATIQRINDSQADFVVVSLGARKGQAWIEHNRPKLNVPVISHLGAVVNLVAGEISRAPVWVQRGGLEWLWRIKEEPALWRRYLGDGMALVRLMFRHALPLAYLLRINRPDSIQIECASMTEVHHIDTVVLKLYGAWVKQNISSLRQVFEEAVRNNRNVILDLSHVKYVDCAFLGLLMMMYGQQLRSGRQLHIEAPSKRVTRIFDLACVNFLLERHQIIVDDEE